MDWCTIESDPGVFTELIEAFGVKDVQVEEIYDLYSGMLEDMQPVHGLIFLFKYVATPDERPVIETPREDLFFARQIINNACATQAILSILLNCKDIDIGPELSNFKEFSALMDYDMRGLTLANSEVIRTHHNSFARPEPFVMDRPKPSASDDDEAFHFIAYVPVNGVVYELDGLKRGPVSLGSYDGTDWLPLTKTVVQERINRYLDTELRFTLLGLVGNITNGLMAQRTPLFSRICAMENKLALLNSGPAPHPTVAEDPELPSDTEILQAVLAHSRQELAQLDSQLEYESTKRQRYKADNQRRRHNYVPFIFSMLKTLASTGKLEELVEKSAAKHRARMEQTKSKV